MITLTNIQISTTITILTKRYEELLDKAAKHQNLKGEPSYSSIKNEMLIIKTTIRDLKNS